VTFGVAGALAHDSSKAATFDGSSGWIDAGNPSSLQVSNGTIEAWIKTTNTDSTYHAVALKWYAYSLFVHNGHIVTYDWGAGAEHDSGVNVADGNWHHVVLTFQSGTTNGTILYVDGTARLTTTITVANQANNALISNGSTTSPQQYFPGTIDEVAYYGHLLTATQVQAHHDAGTH
jgi:hypothetical protein